MPKTKNNQLQSFKMNKLIGKVVIFLLRQQIKQCEKRITAEQHPLIRKSYSIGQENFRKSIMFIKAIHKI